MRIAMVSEHASPLAAVGGVDAGGQNVHVAELAQALAGRGHELTVYTRCDSPDLPQRIQIGAGYVVEHVQAGPRTDVPKDELLPFMPEFGRRLAQCWEASPVDVVHAHFWMSGLASLIGLRGTAVPLVQTFHALGAVKRRYQGAKDTSPLDRLHIERTLSTSADRIVATCSDEVVELQRLGASRERIDTVPCGVDLRRFTPDGPTWERTRRKRLLVVGRLVERKGVDDVIRALADVPDAELVVAGGPIAEALEADPEAVRLLDIAHTCGVADRLMLLGRTSRDDMAALLRSADIVVTVPWYEPFGIVPLEAMACARPVVASAVGGLRDTVIPGRTGELVEPRDPTALAAVLRGLLADEDRCRRYGQAGLKRARTRYGWAQIAQETEKTYERLASRRPVGLEVAR